MAYRDQDAIDWEGYSHNIALALLGEPTSKASGGNEWRYGRKGGLSVNVAKGTWSDFSSGESGGMLDLVTRQTGLRDKAAVEWLRENVLGGGEYRTVTAAERHARKAEHNQASQAAKAEKQTKAKRIWDAARPIAGTLAERYLTGRKLQGPSPYLRYSEKCWHGPKRAELSALIQGITHWPETAISGVQRVYLGSDGRKFCEGDMPSKMMLGNAIGGAVRLVEQPMQPGATLVLCEGVETGLSILAACDFPVWATLSTAGLIGVALPPKEIAARVIIAADNDKNGAGLNAAETLASRLVDDGRDISIILPPDAGQDFNDLHQSVGLDAVRRVIASAKPFQVREFPALKNPDNWPFLVNENGVYWVDEKDNGGETKTQHKRLSGPIHVEAVTQLGDGTGWGRLLCVLDRNGGRSRVVVSSADIADAARGGLFRVLANVGAEISANNTLRGKLLDYLTEAKPGVNVTCAERVGWHEETGAFVLPDASYGGDNDAKVRYWPGNGAKPIQPFRTRGTLDEWKAKIAEPCRGNSRLVFSLCVASMGPMLRLMEGEGGVFHFSGASSIGKTTTLHVAGSFWGGGGMHGFRDTWRATDNALEVKAMAHSDALMCLDELGQADAQAAQKSTYMLSQGVGKSRDSKDGVPRPEREWRVNALSSGEVGMAEKLGESRSPFAMKDGQEARFVEIPADAGKGFGLFEALGEFDQPGLLADHFRLASSEVYGVAGRAFLFALIQNRDATVSKARRDMAAFKAAFAPEGAVSAVERVVARFALVAASGKAASSMGVLPFSEAEIDAAVRKCLRAWIEARGGVGSKEETDAIVKIQALIQKYGQSRFQDFDVRQNEPLIRDRLGYRQTLGSGQDEWPVYYFLPEPFAEEVTGPSKSESAKRLRKSLMARGIIVGNSARGSSKKRIPSEGGKAAWVYEVVKEILDILE